MANNLKAKGMSVVVYDVNAETLNDFSKRGFQVAKTPASLAAVATSIVTMLPSSPHVREVYTNPEHGILSAISRGSLLIDSSTIDPATAREVAELSARKGADMVDAPVSGGVGAAQAGTLTFMVGGSEPQYQKALPLLQMMGKNVVHCGATGTGQVVKLCNNLALAIEMIGISEAMNLGITLGMDAKKMAGIFNTATSRCWSSDTYNPVPGVMENVPASRNYEGGFGVDLMAKDLSLAVAAAHSVKAPIPLGGSALQLYNMLSKHGLGKKDFGSVFAFLSNMKL